MTVVVADTQSVARERLRDLFGSVRGIEVVSEAATGSDAVREVRRFRPDVLVIEPRMPEFGGFAAIREVQRGLPSTAVLVFTEDVADESVFMAIGSGARGLLRKDALPEDIVRAVRSVATGEAIFGPSIADRLCELLSGPKSTHSRPLSCLTAREHEVLDLAAAGMANAAIARRLQLAAKTVRNHLSVILVKLRVDCRADAVVLARDAGLGRAGVPSSPAPVGPRWTRDIINPADLGGARLK